jgi:hypothetical protein
VADLTPRFSKNGLTFLTAAPFSISATRARAAEHYEFIRVSCCAGRSQIAQDQGAPAIALKKMNGSGAQNFVA